MSAPGEPFAAELALLEAGDLTIVGRVVESSNLTFVAAVERGEAYAWAIYKPEAGERFLHDFEPGLHRRERAAFLLSEWLGWHLVPPTVVRDDAPAGPGSVQWFVENDGEHYFTLHERHPETHDALRRVAVFDVVTNNTDRKSGHVLADAERRVWAIDHGLCFHAEPKLRTVVWEFAGEPVPAHLLADLAPLADAVPPAVADLLSPAEVETIRRRVRRLLRTPTLPAPTSHRAYPWPLV